MQYRNLGGTGLKVSALCLGTMQFGWSADEDTSFEVLNAAYDSGINFIDTADIYSRWVPGNNGGVAETIIGKWLQQQHIPRESVVLATKVRGKMGDGPNDEGLSRAHIMNAVDASLRRLQTDYIDLYQTHWFDEHTPIEETLTALDDLIRIGKVRYIGCSNYTAWRLMQSLWASDRLNRARFTSLQPHYNLVHRAEFERELMEVCATYGLGVIPYSPLAGGFLTGKYRKGATEVESARQKSVARYFNDRNWELLDLLEATAKNHNDASISRVSLAWLLHNPAITSPIIGPRTVEQLNDNLGAIELALDSEELQQINTASDWQPC
jgi:aryl-alcohol dehydrogenase-like predicted oxidoreductase